LVINIVYAAPQSNTFIITGEPETKTIKDLLPGVIQQLGPKQFATLQELIKSEVGEQKGGDDAPPDLVAADLNKPE
jgi:nascent polypeptide-associated complex subunit beta